MIVKKMIEKSDELKNTIGESKEKTAMKQFIGGGIEGFVDACFVIGAGATILGYASVARKIIKK